MTISRFDRAPESNAYDLPGFVSAISHDLKEPVRTICCYADLLGSELRRFHDPEAEQLLGRIAEAASRVERLIEDALALALASGSGTNLAEIDAGEAFEFARANLQMAIANSGAAVTAERLPLVKANFGSIAQVFQNLISNAIKFRSAEAPRIHAACSRRVGEWVISVSDNGIGIGEEYRDYVFEPLHRLHSQKKYAGNGLGLAICKQIVTAHGGQIWLESKQNQGTTVFFTLPAAG